jgi:hypothetical protein
VQAGGIGPVHRQLLGDLLPQLLVRGGQRHTLGQQAVLHREDPGALGVAGLGVVEVVLDVVGDVVVHASGIHLAAMVRAAAAEGERSEGDGQYGEGEQLGLGHVDLLDRQHGQPLLSALPAGCEEV